MASAPGARFLHFFYGFFLFHFFCRSLPSACCIHTDPVQAMTTLSSDGRWDGLGAPSLWATASAVLTKATPDRPPGNHLSIHFSSAECSGSSASIRERRPGCCSASIACL